MSAVQPIAEQTETTGIFHYLEAGVESSLYRNSKVLTRRDPDGSDGGTQGVDLEQKTMTVQNARLLDGDAQRTLKSHGFELVTRGLDDPGLDFFDHMAVISNYYPQCAALVSAHTGARAYAFDHNIRSASGKQSQRRIEGGQQVQGPAHLVHGDYTLTSGPERLRALSKPPSGNDTLRPLLAENESLISLADVEQVEAGGRFAIINVWRNIVEDPVATHPMAFCDGQTVEPEDLVVFEIHYQDRIGENYFAKHSDQHRWYYYPAATRDEALLIKQWDSAGPLAQSSGTEGDGSDTDAACTFSFHSAFEDPATPPDAPDRWSMEVRCIVLYP